jgi:hypothetical protein
LYESLKCVNSSTFKAANGVIGTEENQLLDTTLAEVNGLSEKKIFKYFFGIKKNLCRKRGENETVVELQRNGIAFK